MSVGRTFEPDLREIRGVLAEIALERALLGLRHEHLKRKNWQTQPRAPAGQPEGGRWIDGSDGAPRQPQTTAWTALTDGKPEADHKPDALTESTILPDGTRVLSIRIQAKRGEFDEQHAVIAPDGESRVFERSGDTQTIRDGVSGDVLSRTTFTSTELISEPIAQSAFAPAVAPAIVAGIEALQAARTFELALSLLAALSARKEGFGTILGLAAREYIPAEQSQAGLVAWVGQLNQQELDSTCPRNAEVRAITNETARALRASKQYRDKTDFGNKVHIQIAKTVSAMEDPNFKAEVLLNPEGGIANPTQRENVRLDLLENIESTKTVCIYDYKTGEEGLSPSRGLHLAAIASKNFPGIRRIIVIQVRPDQ